MTAPKLIEHAQGLGVTLWRDGDSLAVRGPADKLSPKALERLRELKPLLLPMLPEAPQLVKVGEKTGPDTFPTFSNSEPVFAPNNEARERLPMERTHPHGAHDPMHVRRPHARGNSATYERSTPHKGARPHARHTTPCTGGWRSPERIAQEKLFYRLAIGEMVAGWDPGKPLHQGSTLEDPRRWVELAWGRYAPLWHRCEEATDPALRARLESDRELLFSEALGVILQAAYIESRGA